jgi:hypothetical protein
MSQGMAIGKFESGEKRIRHRPRAEEACNQYVPDEPQHAGDHGHAANRGGRAGQVHDRSSSSDRPLMALRAA